MRVRCNGSHDRGATTFLGCHFAVLRLSPRTLARRELALPAEYTVEIVYSLLELWLRLSHRMLAREELASRAEYTIMILGLDVFRQDEETGLPVLL